MLKRRKSSAETTTLCLLSTRCKRVSVGLMAFGYQHYGVSPDLICCGKGMGNGYPLSGVVGRGDIMTSQL